MRIHCLQHVPFEGPAAIADWARARGHGLEVVHLYREGQLPDRASVEALVVMGGPMGAADDALHAWLAPERDLIAAVVDAGRPMLGVCLGAQLLASALGARVYPAGEREIGWHRVEVGAEVRDTPLASWPAELAPLHWHGDSFDLPHGALHLARTEACESQAFLAGRALGLQFHVEATPTSVDALVSACAGEIGGGRFEQPADAIRSEAPERCAAIRPLLEAALDALF